MRRFLLLLLCTLLTPWSVGSQTRTDAPPGTAFYTVSYTEVLPSAKTAAMAAFREYRSASRMQDGYLRFELFEQSGRPGHFAIIEIWRDQKAFEARGAAVGQQLLDVLKPIRVSDYDQRPYKTLTVAPGPASSSGQMVYVITHVDVSTNPRVPLLLQGMADSSRREAGNARFDVLQHTMRANHFTIIETWQSRNAREAHVAAAHTRQYRDELGTMTGSPLDERIYEAME